MSLLKAAAKLFWDDEPTGVSARRIELIDGYLAVVYFPYNSQLVEELKCVPGAKWHAQHKQWEVPIRVDSIGPLISFAERHRLAIPGDLKSKAGELHAEASFRSTASRAASSDYKVKGLAREPYPFQHAGVEYLVRAERVLLADEMGCIDGDAIVSFNRGGCGKKIHLAHAFKLFHSKWKYSTIITQARCLKNGELRLGIVKDILDKGIRPVVKLMLESGKELRLTSDHEICVGIDSWCPAGRLEPGMQVLTNGTPICVKCGSSEKVSVSSTAKFKGYCRQCIYRYKRTKQTKQGKRIDNDGYVRVSGQFDHPRQCAHNQVYEHILVMEAHLGHPIEWPMQVHHKNGNRSDNAISNLELVTPSQHHIEHNKRLHLPMFHPKKDKVKSVTPDGNAHVYDIVMDDEAHNFTANGIIVHNCGKTIQAIGAAHVLNAFPLAIICPASLKYNWQREMKACLPDKKVFVVNSRKWGAEEHTCLAKMGAKGAFQMNMFGTPPPCRTCQFEEADVIIINYDILADGWDMQGQKSVKLTPAAEAIRKRKPLMQIADESMYIKSDKAQRTLAAHYLVEGTRYRIALTGTPVLNSPIDLVAQLKWLGRLEEFGGWWKFVNRYAGAVKRRFGWEFKRATHAQELNSRMRASFYVRRLKADVIKELPSKQRVVLDVDIDNRQEYEKAQRDLVGWVREKAHADRKYRESIADLDFEEQERLLHAYANDRAQKAKRAEAVVKLSALKQITAKGKLSAAKEWIDNFLETGNKLVVFATHKEILEKLQEMYPTAARIVAEDSAEVRDNNVQTFQGDPCCKLLIGAQGTSANNSPAGVGHTLTAASHCLCLELGWNNALHDQCEDRLHRIGQKDSVTAYRMLGVDTIDQELDELIENKRQMCQEVADGLADEIVGEAVVNELLRRIEEKN